MKSASPAGTSGAAASAGTTTPKAVCSADVRATRLPRSGCQRPAASMTTDAVSSRPSSRATRPGPAAPVARAAWTATSGEALVEVGPQGRHVEHHVLPAQVVGPVGHRAPVGARCDDRTRQAGWQLVGPAPVRGGEGPVGLGVDQPGAQPTTGTGARDGTAGGAAPDDEHVEPWGRGRGVGHAVTVDTACPAGQGGPLPEAVSSGTRGGGRDDGGTPEGPREAYPPWPCWGTRVTSWTTSLRRRNHGLNGGSKRANRGGPTGTNPAASTASCSSARRRS
jgi:hypothetical protein